MSCPDPAGRPARPPRHDTRGSASEKRPLPGAVPGGASGPLSFDVDHLLRDGLSPLPRKLFRAGARTPNAKRPLPGALPEGALVWPVSDVLCHVSCTCNDINNLHVTCQAAGSRTARGRGRAAPRPRHPPRRAGARGAAGKATRRLRRCRGRKCLYRHGMWEPRGRRAKGFQNVAPCSKLLPCRIRIGLSGRRWGGVPESRLGQRDERAASHVLTPHVKRHDLVRIGRPGSDRSRIRATAPIGTAERESPAVSSVYGASGPPRARSAFPPCSSRPGRHARPRLQGPHVPAGGAHGRRGGDPPSPARARRRLRKVHTQRAA